MNWKARIDDRAGGSNVDAWGAGLLVPTLLLVTCCALAAGRPFKNFEGPDPGMAAVAKLKSESQLLILSISRVEAGQRLAQYSRRKSDGDLKMISPSSYLLTSGRYQIDLKIESWPTPGTPEPEEFQLEVDLVAGHEYKARSQWCAGPWGIGVCRERRNQATAWIEDKTTGQIVAGVKWFSSTASSRP